MLIRLSKIILTAILFLSLWIVPSFSQANSSPSYLPTQMKTIGIIGGVSWVSTLEYYRLLNQLVQKKEGDLASANILLYSIEFEEFSKQERLAEKGNWEPLRATMRDAAKRLKNGGAKFIIIASNTMNSSAPDIEKNIHIPVLHIADATAEAVSKRGLKKVALLGTSYTMETSFYREKLEQKGIQVLLPTAAERKKINQIIFDELCANVFTDSSRQQYVAIIERLAKKEGAEGVILGCTEIPLLIKQSDVSIPVFDTTAIHCEAAVAYSIGEK